MNTLYNNSALVLMIGAIVVVAMLLAFTKPGGAFDGMMPAFAGATGSSHVSWLAPLRNSRVGGRNKGDVALWTHANIDKAEGGGGSGGGGGTATLDERIERQLSKLDKRFEQLDLLEKEVKEGKTASEKMAEAIAEIQKHLLEFRKLNLASRALSNVRRTGGVSDACSEFLGALYLRAQVEQGKVAGERAVSFNKRIDGILGADHKTALSSSDIPLPTQYSGEVVELVSEYGVARRLATVFPLGAGTVKLPSLSTDPTFGLIAQSAAVTEKSPQVAWVTFSPEKFGGLIRLPTELDDDSIIAIGQFIARYGARNIARVEDYNFFMSTGAGSGANGSVKGLCLSTIDNSKVVQMASSKTKYSDATLANLRAMRATVDAPVIGTGKYFMHPSFEQLLSGLNASGDKPYQAMAGKNPTLDGYEIVWVDVMPAYSTSANVSKVFVLFGDISYQYLGVRSGVRYDVSKDAGFTTDETLVRVLERFTIGLMATGAVSGLETAAS